MNKLKYLIKFIAEWEESLRTFREEILTDFSDRTPGDNYDFWPPNGFPVDLTSFESGLKSINQDIWQQIHQELQKLTPPNRHQAIKSITYEVSLDHFPAWFVSSYLTEILTLPGLIFNNISNFDTELIRKLDSKINWNQVSSSSKLSEDLMKEFADKLNWQAVCSSQILSEKFIREFSDQVNWSFIAMSQNLSEEFITEFAQKFSKNDWEYLFIHQDLSEQFVEENINKFSHCDFLHKKNASVNFYLKHIDKIKSSHLELNKILFRQDRSKSDINKVIQAYTKHQKQQDIKRLEKQLAELKK